MELKRRFGVVIVCGIPAIVGSGLFWELSEKWTVVFGYLLLLAFTLLVFLVAPERLISYSHIWKQVSGRVNGIGSKLRRSIGS